MNKKKLMILGASVLQLPAIIQAKEMGIVTIAVDMDKNAIGFAYADYCVPISTNDIPNIIEAAQKHQIDGIMTLATDMPMNAVAAVAEEMDLVGLSREAAAVVTNKAAMRKVLKSNGVPIPQFFVVETLTEFKSAISQFKTKFIVKPADSSGSRGVSLVEAELDLSDKVKAFDYSKQYAKNGKVLVEEYMTGPEVSVETITIDGESFIVAVTDKLTTGAPYFVEMGHSIPSRLPSQTLEKIKQVAAATISAMDIKNGPSHTEIIVTADGPKVVEIGARLGGDNITTHLVPLATGINLVEATIKVALNEKPHISVKPYEKAAAIRYINSQTGTITAIKVAEKLHEIPEIKQITITKKIGTMVDGIKNSNDRIGFVIVQHENAVEAIKTAEAAIANIEIDYGLD